MKKDSLARRLRFAPPSPVVERLVLTERDYLLFEAINRHGPLPTNYLFEFTKHEARSFAHLQRRLTELYNGDNAGPYLSRPQQQFAGFEARYQHVVYDLASRAKTALAERGVSTRFSPKRSDPFLHQLMQACVGASFELYAPQKGLRYISREEVLTHEKCPSTTREAANPMALPLSGMGEQKALLPDDLFGLEYPGVGFRFFAVEIDRNTESIERKSPSQNSFGRKIASYLEVLKSRSYRDWWGLPNLTILTVTTNGTHAANIADFVRRQNEPAYAERFAFAWEPAFGANWRVPRTVLFHLLDEPLMTPGAPRDISRP